MWVGEKYNEAADPATQRTPFWIKAILTTASLYYFTGCIMPSMLTYYENVRHHEFAEYAMRPENRIQVPFGYTSFFWDTEPSSKRAVERTGNLVFYNGMPLLYCAVILLCWRCILLTDCLSCRTQRWWPFRCAGASDRIDGGRSSACRTTLG
jgi:hypothetical protein